MEWNSLPGAGPLSLPFTSRPLCRNQRGGGAIWPGFGFPMKFQRREESCALKHDKWTDCIVPVDMGSEWKKGSSTIKFTKLSNN